MAEPARRKQGPAMRIVCDPDAFTEGLFGQILLQVFEILPYLQSRSILPDWGVTSKIYGTAPEYLVLPGVFDLAYTPRSGSVRQVDLFAIRDYHTSILGGDREYAHRLWTSFFSVPPRILEEADRMSLPPDTLGLHYRGTDKNRSVDTNPVGRSEFLRLAAAFARERGGVGTVFVAADEPRFARDAALAFPGRRIVTLGDPGFHKSGMQVPDRADRALLDCVLLSRCRYVLKCSSALSAFSVVLNPALEAYRVAASRLSVAGIPYFPDAYVPPLELGDPGCSALLARLLSGDWTEDPASGRFLDGGRPRHFDSVPRYGFAGCTLNRMVRMVKPAVRAALATFVGVGRG